MSDRRKHPRYEVTFRVKFKDAEAFLEEYGKNISKGGIFIKTSNLKEIGSLVRTIIELPETGEEIETDGRVVYLIDERIAREKNLTPGMGIQFLETGEEFKEKIERCLNKLASSRISDRRKSPRAVLKIHISIEAPRGEERIEEHYLLDFSSKGIFVKTPKIFPEGTDVTLLIEIPSASYTKKFEGKVRWGGEKNGRERGIGIEFHLGEKEIKSFLTEIIEKIFNPYFEKSEQ